MRRLGALTISPVDTSISVADYSPPLAPTGEHYAAGCPSGAPPGTRRPTRIRGTTGPRVWVYGTLAHVFSSVNAIIFPTQLSVLHEHEGGIYPDGSNSSAVG